MPSHVVYAEEQTAVENGRTVSIEYVLTLNDGTVASTNVGQEPLNFTHGDGKLLPGLEAALHGMKSGEKKDVSLSAEEGYGAVNPDAFVKVPVDLIPEDARKAGTMLVGRDPSGNERYVRVHEVQEEQIVIDQNHPLAGETLHFKVTVISVE
jgi:FKBP-type peptidyl-prolyl cis-trans isomerase 2